MSPSGVERGMGSSAGAYSIVRKTGECLEGSLPACGQRGQPLARDPFPSLAAKSVCLQFLLSLAALRRRQTAAARVRPGTS